MNSTGVALLIVDVQNGFVHEHTVSIPEKVEELQHSYELVFATQFYNPNPSNFRRLIDWHNVSLDSPEYDLAFKLKPGSVRIPKPGYSCVDFGFISRLHLSDVSEVHVVGIDTSICVLKSAVDLFEAGFRPVVLKDYCASTRGKAVHEAAIANLARFIGIRQIR